MESLLNLLIACAMGALIGSISYRSYRPSIANRFNSKPVRRKLPRPTESEKHRLIMEVFRRIDDMPREELSPAAAYILKKARRESTSLLYGRTEEMFNELEERICRSQIGGSTLNAIGLYRTAVRLALLGIADDRISDLRSEVLSWGFDEVAPIAGADLDVDSEDSRKVSGIAVPISLG